MTDHDGSRAEVAKQPPRSGAERLASRLRRTGGGAAAEAGGIRPVERDRPLPLSFAQQRLWFVDRLRPGGLDYLVPIVLRLSGPLDAGLLAHALRVVVQRHEILRTRYVTGPDGEPAQVVDPAVEIELRFDDRLGESHVDLDAVLHAELTVPFDLSAGPALRALLIRLDHDKHVLALLTHHIAMDAWSAAVLIREVGMVYAGDEQRLPSLPIQYADFAVWQREHGAGQLAGGLAYWHDRLTGLPPLELPTDRPRPAVWDPTGATVGFVIPAELAERIAVLARTRRATAFMAYLAAFWALLGRYTGQDDFAVGTPVAGRTRIETDPLIGVFINMLPLRADLRGTPSFVELLDRARTTSIDAYTHQEVPFDRLVNELAPDRDASTHPLFQVNFILQNNEPARFSAAGVTAEEQGVAATSAKFDLTWTLEERADGSVTVEVTYACALFDQATAERMAGHYLRLLDAATADPDRRIDALPMTGPEEMRQLIRPPAGTAPAGPCLHERFAARAAEAPQRVALRDQGSTVTYGELDERANRLAHALRARGIGRDDLVAICLPRGADMLTAILGVLKSGGAYLPLDPDHPTDRLAYVIEDAGAHVVVTDEATSGRLPAVGPQPLDLVRLDDARQRNWFAALPATAPAVDAHPDDLAYVIYTSGSTGRPKGVQVTHANVVRLFTATEQEYRFGSDDRWALFHTYAFDVSVWEMWGAFLHGGRLVVVPSTVARSPWDLVELLADEGVTVLNQTPSAFHNLVLLAGRGEPALDRLDLRLVVLAGEPVEVTTLRPWWDRFGDTRPQIVNMYGITETTVHVTYRPLGRADLDGERSPIGRPMRDLTMYVLDDAMRPVPVGVPGEIYVGGPGVARGYRDRPSLTAQRFVPDPYGPPGARLYRSGDKARVLPDGDVGFLGRLDQQVKIRGFRIELGEVEAALLAHPDVDAAVVAVHEPEPGQPQLVGYLLGKPGRGLSTSLVRAAAAQRLPDYMLPALLIELSELPLTVNGKVDRRALPRPDAARPDDGQEYVAPRSPAEKAVAAAFGEVLGLAEVGAQHSFFALGGDSIRAVRLIGQLRADGFDVSVQDLFRYQSVAELVQAAGAGAMPVEQLGVEPFTLVDDADRGALPDGLVDAYPMSMGQTGMIYEMIADPDRNLYHNVTSYLMRDDGPFDGSALTAAAEAVVARHEVLRTSFDLTSYREPLQLVHSRARPHIGLDDLRGMTAADQEATLAAFREQERAAPFDLTRPPLVRLHAHRISDDRWYLSFTECHAVLDGWSHNSLITELLAAYRAVRAGLPAPVGGAPAIRYADFIALERRSLQQPEHREFWAGRLADAERLTIPPGWAEPDSPPSREVVVPLGDLRPGLQALAVRAGTGLKSVLLAAHVAVWRAVTGSARFHFGLVCNGRPEVAGGDRVAGMFLNPVPFAAPAHTDTWRELVRAVFDEEGELWPHRRFPLPELQRLLGDGSRLIEVAFNYLDFHVLDRQTVDVTGTTDESPNEFPLAISTESAGLVITTQAGAVGPVYLQRLADMYAQVLALMAADPDGNARQSLLPPGERARLIAAGTGPTGPAAPTARPSVHELVARWATTTPDAIAVRAGGEAVTHRELDRAAAAWTTRLSAAGVGRGDVVGVCLPRGRELVAVMLGVLRTGASYLPTDPYHPPERVAALLADVQARTVVTTAEFAAKLPADVPTTVISTGAVPDAVPADQLVLTDADELVYVVHTSGSSGRPKGVMISHGALTERVHATCELVGIGPGDVLVAVVPTTTDVAQLDFFTALVSGCELVVAGEDLARDPTSLAQLLDECGATVMQCSPTTWRMLLEAGWRPAAGFRGITGGEAMPAELIGRLCATGVDLWDMYGPNEAAIFVFGTRFTADGAVDRFALATDTTAYVLGADLEPVPDGVVGQLYLGGAHLARGYVGRPGLTAEAFIPDPHAATPGGRLYATGDLARRERNGRIRILGRIDEQVKVRGFRVEVGEVESVLLGHPSVRAAVVAPVDAGDGSRQLAAYVISAGGSFDPAELLAFTAQRLPDYLTPTWIVPVESYPRLANGKVHRAALQVSATRLNTAGRKHRPPQGPVEQAIAAVWAHLIGVEPVGRDDDFFAIGGHSLLMMRAISRLREEHRVEVTFGDFLQGRTVSGIASRLADPGASGHRPLMWLGEAGQRPPLFCVHPGGGSGHWYQELAEEYAPDRPVAAFEWPGLHGDDQPARSVEHVAGRYLAELRAVRPAGEYHILGWCGSSGIAWEMARQLHADGEQVRLVLLDPVVDVSRGDAEAHVAKLEVFRRAERLFDALADPADPERDVIRLELAEELRDIVDEGADSIKPEDIDDTWLYRLRSWRQLLECRLEYSFPPYAGPVDLILCDELVAEEHESIKGQSYRDYLARWEGLATGGLRVHRVPGDHLGVLRPPHVTRLAAVLSAVTEETPTETVK